MYFGLKEIKKYWLVFWNWLKKCVLSFWNWLKDCWNVLVLMCNNNEPKPKRKTKKK